MKISIPFLATLLMLAVVTTSTAQVETRSYLADKGLIPREHTVDFTHLKLEVEFEPEQKLVKGKVTEKFITRQKETDSLFLDGVNMTFNTVKVDGVEAKYKKSAKGITLYFSKGLAWGSTHELFIDYPATPKKGLYFIGEVIDVTGWLGGYNFQFSWASGWACGQDV